MLLDAGRPGEALARVERVQPILEAQLGPRDPDVAQTLSLKGRALLELGRAGEAVTTLTTAVELSVEVKATPYDVAIARFALARALRAAGRDRERARALAQEARAGFAAAGAGGGEGAAVEAWLAGKP